MSVIQGSKPGFRLIEFPFDKKPEDGITLRSTGWSEGTGGSWANLECTGCGAQFLWSAYKSELRWMPSRRHLNFCPGCGKTITGIEIPHPKPE